MNGLDLLRSMNGLDPELVGSVALPRRRKRRHSMLIAAVIGAVLLIIAGAVIYANLSLFRPEGKTVENSPAPEDGVMSYVSVIKYGGRVYRFASHGGAENAVGKKLGTVEALIPPGASPESYPDMSASFDGDIFEAAGFDPGSVICTDSGSAVGYYVYLGEAQYGREVLEDRFRVSERLVSAVYEGEESLLNGYGERFLLDPALRSDLLNIISALDEAEFTVFADAEALAAVTSREQWRLKLDIGAFDVYVTLFEGGYASAAPYSGTSLLRIDEKKIARFCELLASGEHGTPVEFDDSVRSIRPEQLSSIPLLGGYFPEDPPAGYAAESIIVLYEVDDATGAAMTDRIAGVSVEYRGADDYNKVFRLYARSVERMRDDLRGVDADKRSDAPIDALTADNVFCGAPDAPEFYEVTAYDDRVGVTVHALSSLTPEEAVELLRGCFGK